MSRKERKIVYAIGAQKINWPELALKSFRRKKKKKTAEVAEEVGARLRPHNRSHGCAHIWMTRMKEILAKQLQGGKRPDPRYLSSAAAASLFAKLVLREGGARQTASKMSDQRTKERRDWLLSASRAHGDSASNSSS
jgi:hypothetical protein